MGARCRHHAQAAPHRAHECLIGGEHGRSATSAASRRGGRARAQVGHKVTEPAAGSGRGGRRHRCSRGGLGGNSRRLGGRRRRVDAFGRARAGRAHRRSGGAPRARVRGRAAALARRRLDQLACGRVCSLCERRELEMACGASEQRTIEHSVELARRPLRGSVRVPLPLRLRRHVGNAPARRRRVGRAADTSPQRGAWRTAGRAFTARR